MSDFEGHESPNYEEKEQSLHFCVEKKKLKFSRVKKEQSKGEYIH